MSSSQPGKTSAGTAASSRRHGGRAGKGQQQAAAVSWRRAAVRGPEPERTPGSATSSDISGKRGTVRPWKLSVLPCTSGTTSCSSLSQGREVYLQQQRHGQRGSGAVGPKPGRCVCAHRGLQELPTTEAGPAWLPAQSLLLHCTTCQLSWCTARLPCAQPAPGPHRGSSSTLPSPSIIAISSRPSLILMLSSAARGSRRQRSSELISGVRSA